jgi:hypothetical protein
VWLAIPWYVGQDENKGIQGLFGRAGIEYFSFVELGNLFQDFDDWQARYQSLTQKMSGLLTERLSRVPVPFCLMCAEKSADHCHRAIITEYLAKKGFEIEHIE